MSQPSTRWTKIKSDVMISVFHGGQIPRLYMICVA